MYAELARVASPDGEVWTARATLARRLGVSERTVTRWRGRLEDAGHLARIDGGHRGRTVHAVLTGLRGVMTRKRRALASIFAARRERLAALRWPGKGDSPVTLTTTQGGAEGAHAYRPGPDDPGWCACGLPAANRRHRKG
jgi:hypothetical protein